MVGKISTLTGQDYVRIANVINAYNPELEAQGYDTAEKLFIYALKVNQTQALQHGYIYIRMDDASSWYTIKELLAYNPYIKFSLSGKYIAVNYKSIIDMICNGIKHQYNMSICDNNDLLSEAVHTIAWLSKIHVAVEEVYGDIIAYEFEKSLLAGMGVEAGCDFQTMFHQVYEDEIRANAPEILMVTLKLEDEDDFCFITSSLLELSQSYTILKFESVYKTIFHGWMDINLEKELFINKFSINEIDIHDYIQFNYCKEIKAIHDNIEKLYK